MTSSVANALNNGGIGKPGRQQGSKNRYLLEMHRIGEENCRELYDMQVVAARNGNLEAGQFLINKVLPNAKGVRVIQIDLPELDTVENIHSAERMIMNYVCKGDITIEEGERLIAIAKNSRETIQTTEVMVKIAALEEKMKETRTSN